MDPILVGIVAAVVGILVGAWGYRYMLKRNPEELEKWAQDIKAARVKASTTYTDYTNKS